MVTRNKLSLASASDAGDCGSGDKYECPVCFDDLLPPIFQCFNGHLFCNKCIEKLAVCPICRDDLPQKKIKALAVENIVRESLCPCPFVTFGCKELLTNKSQSIEEHRFSCSFALLNYCSLLGLKCDKKVKKEKLYDHFNSSHKGIYLGRSVYGEEVEVSEDGHRIRKPLAVIQIEDEPFILKWSCDENSKMLSWKVLFLGTEKKACEFVASIKLIPISPLNVDNYASLEWKGPLFSLQSSSDNPERKQNLFSVPYQHFPSLFSVGETDEKVKWRIVLKMRRSLEDPELNLQMQNYGHSHDQAGIVHTNVRCDGCNDGRNITGVRHKCIECPDFDLCGKCTRKNIHAHHLFVTVPRPNMIKQLKSVLKTGSKVLSSSLGSESRNSVVHPHISCDGCKVGTCISGNRYKCIECPDFDLCADCMEKKIHSRHLFVVLPNNDMRERLRRLLK